MDTPVDTAVDTATKTATETAADIAGELCKWVAVNWDASASAAKSATESHQRTGDESPYGFLTTRKPTLFPNSGE